MQTCHNRPNVLFEQFRIYNATYFKRKYRLAVKCSLRRQAFPSGFPQVWSIFSLFETRENWGKRKKVRKGGGEGRKGNACPQTPWFWKTCSSMNGVFWLAQHGSDKSISQIKYVHLSVTRMNTTNWLLSLSCLVWLSHTNRLSLFLPDVLFQLVNHRCSGLFRKQADSLPIAFRITSNNAPKFRLFERKNCTGTQSKNNFKFWTTSTPTALQRFSPVNLWNFVGEDQTNCNRICFTILRLKVAS